MRHRGVFLLAALALTGCVVPEPQADPVQQEEPQAETNGETQTVSQGMPVPPDHVMSAEEHRGCYEKGGFVDRRGMIGAEVCVMPYADGGKACTDGDECEGRCIAEGRVGTPPGETITGICQRDDHLFGCFGIVEDGRIEAGLCVD
ncbi:hypothetical protein [Qipengyuania sphaerica]|uniref:hypothetical protein n=1 Tax=Qipengyuania sphaerica TaxID=2867243 RepID=UPI001C886F71|nr:hypothetical protein [Qipengyuania sphaerica]MBX7540233.1 hypothetical protein [Qipengyuania sphaerica]